MMFLLAAERQEGRDGYLHRFHSKSNYTDGVFVIILMKY